MSGILDRIHASLIGLRMPRALEALEALEHTMRQLERGELSALEAIDRLLSEEHVTREGRLVTVALKTARLMPIKTPEGFDFAFQPSLDHGRILVDLFVDQFDLAGLGFTRAAHARTGRPGYHPAILLKLFICGYLNRVPSSRGLEREAGRNVEVM